MPTQFFTQRITLISERIATAASTADLDPAAARVALIEAAGFIEAALKDLPSPAPGWRVSLLVEGDLVVRRGFVPAADPTRTKALTRQLKAAVGMGTARADMTIKSPTWLAFKYRNAFAMDARWLPGDSAPQEN